MSCDCLSISCLQEDNVYSAISFGLGVQRARHIQSVTPWGEDDQEQQQSPMEDLAAEAADAQAKVSRVTSSMPCTYIVVMLCPSAPLFTQPLLLAADEAAGSSSIGSVHEECRCAAAKTSCMGVHCSQVAACGLAIHESQASSVLSQVWTTASSPASGSWEVTSSCGRPSSWGCHPLCVQCWAPQK